MVAVPVCSKVRWLCECVLPSAERAQLVARVTLVEWQR